MRKTIEMAQYTETQAVRGTSFFARIEEGFARLRQDLRARREVRRTYNELSKLSNRELDDLGITRSDIVRISRESVRDY